MKPTKIFISYAREDQEIAKKVYEDLKTKKVNPWLDCKSLLPGQNWFLKIKENIQNCDYFLALLSSHSVTKKGIMGKIKHLGKNGHRNFE